MRGFGGLRRCRDGFDGLLLAGQGRSLGLRPYGLGLGGLHRRLLGCGLLRRGLPLGHHGGRIHRNGLRLGLRCGRVRHGGVLGLRSGRAVRRGRGGRVRRGLRNVGRSGGRRLAGDRLRDDRFCRNGLSRNGLPARLGRCLNGGGGGLGAGVDAGLHRLLGQGIGSGLHRLLGHGGRFRRLGHGGRFRLLGHGGGFRLLGHGGRLRLLGHSGGFRLGRRGGGGRLLGRAFRRSRLSGLCGPLGHVLLRRPGRLLGLDGRRSLGRSRRRVGHHGLFHRRGPGHGPARLDGLLRLGRLLRGRLDGGRRGRGLLGGHRLRDGLPRLDGSLPRFGGSLLRFGDGLPRFRDRLLGYGRGFRRRLGLRLRRSPRGAGLRRDLASCGPGRAEGASAGASGRSAPPACGPAGRDGAAVRVAPAGPRSASERTTPPCVPPYVGASGAAGPRCRGGGRGRACRPGRGRARERVRR